MRKSFLKVVLGLAVVGFAWLPNADARPGRVRGYYYYPGEYYATPYVGAYAPGYPTYYYNGGYYYRPFRR